MKTAAWDFAKDFASNIVKLQQIRGKRPLPHYKTLRAYARKFQPTIELHQVSIETETKIITRHVGATAPRPTKGHMVLFLEAYVLVKNTYLRL